MKRVLIIVGAVVLAVLIAAGSFWGGIAYQTNKVSQAQANFFSARGQAGAGQFPNGGQVPGNFGGRGTTGQVKSIAGNVLTLSTAQDIATVNLSDSTQIQKTVSGTVSDLQPGTQVVVTGQKDSKGVITATQIRIVNNEMPLLPGSAATQVAP